MNLPPIYHEIPVADLDGVQQMLAPPPPQKKKKIYIKKIKKLIDYVSLNPILYA